MRGHIGQTPLANLQATLTADLNRIWESSSEPTDLKVRLLSDYFDWHSPLYHIKWLTILSLMSMSFVLGSSKRNTVNFFQPAYHKHIPADGVAFYMEGIWVSAFPCGFKDTLKQSD